MRGVHDFAIMEQFVYQQCPIRAVFPLVQEYLQQMSELRFSPVYKLRAIPSHGKCAEESHIQHVVLLLHIRFTASQKAKSFYLYQRKLVSSYYIDCIAQNRHSADLLQSFSTHRIHYKL